MQIKDMLKHYGILNTALEDGVITLDERLLLQNISENYGEYHEFLEEAVEDGIIGDDEAETLREMRKKMYLEALQTAMRDGIISSDERAILAVLKKSLKLDRNTFKTIEDDVLIKHKMHGYDKYMK